MVEIEYVGLNKVESDLPNVQDHIKSISQHYLERIERLVEIGNIKVQIKDYGKGGHAHKYSVHVHINIGGNKLSAEKADWDISKTLHKVFNEIEKQITHKFKLDEK